MLYQHIAPIYKELIEYLHENIQEQRKTYQTTSYDQISNIDIVQSLNKNKKLVNKFKFSLVPRDIGFNSKDRDFLQCSFLQCSIFTEKYTITLEINHNSHMELKSIYIKELNQENFVYAINKNFSMITASVEQYALGISTFYNNGDSHFVLMPKFNDILIDYNKPNHNDLSYNEKEKRIEFQYDYLNQDQKDMLSIVLDHSYNIQPDINIIFTADLKPSYNEDLSYIKKLWSKSFKRFN